MWTKIGSNTIVLEWFGNWSKIGQQFVKKLVENRSKNWSNDGQNVAKDCLKIKQKLVNKQMVKKFLVKCPQKRLFYCVHMIYELCLV